MKKILMGAVAMLMVLMMGTTVFAASSPGADAALDQKAQEWNDQVKSAVAQGTNNTVINVTKTKVEASKVTSANEAAKGVSAAAEVIGMSDLSVAKGVDASKGIKLTLSVDPKSIKDGYSVYVLHQFGDGKWEILKPSKVTADGKITVTMYSFSPVAIVQYPNNVDVPVSDPSKNQTDDSNAGSDSDGKGNNPAGPTQNNNNNQKNDQSNNQNNQVNVNQNVTVNYPDGTSAAKSDRKNGGQVSGGTTSAGVLSPKTSASFPILTIVALFAVAGIAVCGKKAYFNR